MQNINHVSLNTEGQNDALVEVKAISVIRNPHMCEVQAN